VVFVYEKKNRETLTKLSTYLALSLENRIRISDG